MRPLGTRRDDARSPRTGSRTRAGSRSAECRIACRRPREPSTGELDPSRLTHLVGYAASRAAIEMRKVFARHMGRST